MKVFVTGATGFIGGHVVQRLAQTQHETVCLVRVPQRAGKMRELGATVVEGDVTDKKSVLEGMNGCDWVFHLANIYDFWLPQKRAYREVNVEGTRNVMEAALEKGITKVVHVSTIAIWDKCPRDATVNEETPVITPQATEYARTKYAGDLVAWDLHKRSGLPLVVIHPGGVLGKGDNKLQGKSISNHVNGQMPFTAFGDSVFGWVHVEDVADGILRAAERPDNTGQNYILAGENWTISELLGTSCQIAGVGMPRLAMPNVFITATAGLLTVMANITKRPPMWGMSLDAARWSGCRMRTDGSKAQRELSLTYKPVRTALEEAVPSYLMKPC